MPQSIAVEDEDHSKLHGRRKSWLRGAGGSIRLSRKKMLFLTTVGIFGILVLVFFASSNETNADVVASATRKQPQQQQPSARSKETIATAQQSQQQQQPKQEEQQKRHQQPSSSKLGSEQAQKLTEMRVLSQASMNNLFIRYPLPLVNVPIRHRTSFSKQTKQTTTATKRPLASADEETRRLIAFVQSNAYECVHQVRLWEPQHSELCFDRLIRQIGCTVYDFGVHFDFAFDDWMAGFGCLVKSFDPNMALQPTLRSERTAFYDFALGMHDEDYEYRDPGVEYNTNEENMEYAANKAVYRVRRMDTLMESMADEVIDVLKVKLDENGWKLIKQWIDGGLIKRIKQFVLQIQFWGKGQEASPDNIRQWLETFQELHRIGIRVFHSSPIPPKTTTKQTPLHHRRWRILLIQPQPDTQTALAGDDDEDDDGVSGVTMTSDELDAEPDDVHDELSKKYNELLQLRKDGEQRLQMMEQAEVAEEHQQREDDSLPNQQRQQQRIADADIGPAEPEKKEEFVKGVFGDIDESAIAKRIQELAIIGSRFDKIENAEPSADTQDVASKPRK